MKLYIGGRPTFVYVFLTFFNVFYVFLRFKKHDFLRFFELLHTFSRTLLEGGLSLLHEADDDAVIWLESTATAARAK